MVVSIDTFDSSVIDFNGPIRTNALAFDLEHWHSATLLKSSVDDPIDHVEDSVEIVLDILRKRDVSATFFVAGEVAEEYPELIERIWKEGHEIGSHCHSHTPLFDLTPEEFESELDRTSAAIKNAIGVEPLGFRAPDFSITRNTEWAFDVLESKDYLYDSSVFPLSTPLYGVSGAPVRPYHVASDDRFRVDPAGSGADDLVEFPLSAIDLPVRAPIAGGFYARVLPERVLRWGIRRLNRRGIPANLYFHPWEFNPSIQFDSSQYYKRFVSSYGRERIGAKLDGLLGAFDFDTLRSVLEEQGVLDSDRGRNVERIAKPNNTE
jgi:polysaccharide deacetylase family protein (PEP-CTERM system associated)